jgi:hypothetical protein
MDYIGGSRMDFCFAYEYVNPQQTHVLRFAFVNFGIWSQDSWTTDVPCVSPCFRNRLEV